MGRDGGLISSEMRTGSVNVREGRGESMIKGQRSPGDTQASSPLILPKIRGTKESPGRYQCILATRIITIGFFRGPAKEPKAALPAFLSLCCAWRLLQLLLLGA